MSNRHPLYEDVISMFCGTFFVAFGIVLLKENSLISAGTVGLSLVLDTLTDADFAVIFCLVNLPFYWLSLRQLGMEFTFKTFLSVSVVAAMVHYIPDFIQFKDVSIAFSGVIGGIFMGIGGLFTFRHGSSLGGIGILAYYAQKRFGLRAGKVLMCFDVPIVSCSFVLSDFTTLFFSILAAVILNALVIINHRDDRYQVV